MEKSCKYSLLSLVVFLGIIYGVLYIKIFAGPPLSKAFANKVFQVEGVVDSFPSCSAHACQFYFKQNKYPYRLKLIWYGKHTSLHLGERWRFWVKIIRAHRYKHTNKFNVEKYLLSQHVRGQAVILSHRSVKKLSDTSAWIYSVQRNIASYIDTQYKDEVSGALLKALILGVRDRRQHDLWKLFQRTGTSHLIAISGLHIGLVAGMIYLCIYHLIRYIPRVTHLVSAKKVALVVSMFAILGYGWLANWVISILRALVMFFIAGIALLANRHLPIFRLYTLTIVICFILNPLIFLSMSFYLSMLAVAIIFISHHRYPKQKKKWKAMTMFQYEILCVMLPLVFYDFQQFNLLSFFANLIAVPIISFIVLPFGFLSLFFSTHIMNIALVNSWIISHLITLLSWVNILPYVHVHLIISSWVSVLLGCIAFSVLLLPRGLPGKWLVMMVLLSLLIADYPCFEHSKGCRPHFFVD